MQKTNPVKKSKKILDEKNRQKLKKLNNKFVLQVVNKYIDLLKPAKVTVSTNHKKDISYIRKLALTNKEEKKLFKKGHTIHFDGPLDQGRDKKNTLTLLGKGESLGKQICTGERTKCLKEIFALLDGAMKNKEMLILFYCLGPANSQFSIPALQITDSSYVAHSENILYRQGYKEFQKLNGSSHFFHFVHSTGKLENGISKNTTQRKVYIDLKKNRVFSINTQYAGNTLGLKKLALRLAIKQATKKNWLCEHMLLMGVKPKNKKRVTYFSGAFPSACGKTSTAMIDGQTILGDDIAYLKPNKDGYLHAANVEQGIFGIIENVNTKDDKLIYKALTTPRELIFSNVLVKNNKPYWLGMGKKLPESGVNFTGNWKKGMKDKNGNAILPAHKNARYTIRLEELPNCDKNLHNPKGVPLSGIIYGGRDSDTSPPVTESFNWFHGVFYGASLESETTAATLGKTGVRKHNLMANIDFLVIPLGAYIQTHLNMGKNLKYPPTVFNTNYFLQKKGKFLNAKTDKKVWLYWMEGRIHGEYQARVTPIGFIPRFADLQKLFFSVFKKKYSKKDYIKQFSIRINRLLEKLDRIESNFQKEKNIPEIIFAQIEKQRIRLKEEQKKHKKNTVSPFSFHLLE